MVICGKCGYHHLTSICPLDDQIKHRGRPCFRCGNGVTGHISSSLHCDKEIGPYRGDLCDQYGHSAADHDALVDTDPKSESSPESSSSEEEEAALQLSPLTQQRVNMVDAVHGDSQFGRIMKQNIIDSSDSDDSDRSANSPVTPRKRKRQRKRQRKRTVKKKNRKKKPKKKKKTKRKKTKRRFTNE